jgi:hypothetical protein
MMMRGVWTRDGLPGRRYPTVGVAPSCHRYKGSWTRNQSQSWPKKGRMRIMCRDCFLIFFFILYTWYVLSNVSYMKRVINEVLPTAKEIQWVTATVRTTNVAYRFVHRGRRVCICVTGYWILGLSCQVSGKNGKRRREKWIYDFVSGNFRVGIATDT